MSEDGVVINCFDPLAILEILQEIISSSDDILSAVEARFNLWKLVITCESVDKTSNVVWNG